MLRITKKYDIKRIKGLSDEAGRKEVKNERNNIQHTGKAGALRAYNSKNEALFCPIQTLRDLQKNNGIKFFDSFIGCHISIFGNSCADGDNILKGIMDGLQGVAFENDKQVRKGSFEFCVGKN